MAASAYEPQAMLALGNLGTTHVTILLTGPHAATALGQLDTPHSRAAIRSVVAQGLATLPWKARPAQPPPPRVIPLTPRSLGLPPPPLPLEAPLCPAGDPRPAIRRDQRAPLPPPPERPAPPGPLIRSPPREDAAAVPPRPSRADRDRSRSPGRAAVLLAHPAAPAQAPPSAPRAVRVAQIRIDAAFQLGQAAGRFLRHEMSIDAYQAIDRGPDVKCSFWAMGRSRSPIRIGVFKKTTHLGSFFNEQELAIGLPPAAIEGFPSKEEATAWARGTGLQDAECPPYVTDPVPRPGM